MLKLLLNILLVIGSLLYLSGPSITFKPFYIRFETLILPFGILLVVIGLSIVNQYYYKIGKEEGKKMVKEVVKEYFEEERL